MTTLPSPQSYWVSSTSDPPLPPRTPLPDVDVAVLGAGIAGLTTAYLLAERGRSVAVIEAGRIGTGTTGHTTAKVTVQHGLAYARIAAKHGVEAARAYGASQTAAFNWLVDQAASADCDFEHRDSYVYAEDPGRIDDLKQEADVAAECGLPASFVPDVDLPFAVAGAVRFAGQAQFHPRKWLVHLTRRLNGAGAHVFTGVRATGLTEGDPCRIETTAGQMRAREVVVATHYPIFDRGLFFGRLSLVRDLVVAGPAPSWAEDLPGTYFAADTGHSIRTAPLPAGGRLLIVGGEHFRTGEEDDVDGRYGRLAAWARERLGLEVISHRWSAHDMSGADGLPYIGRYHPAADHVWVATGFAAWGMTNGTLAGLLLADLVSGERNPWAPLYEPNRLNLIASAKSLASNNLTVARHEITDRFVGTEPAPASLKPGEAAVTRYDGRLVAAYRDPHDVLHCVSARCTHLGCVVGWNNAEKTWDCPCHGSRFQPDGEIIEGPATAPLAPWGGKGDPGPG